MYTVYQIKVNGVVSYIGYTKNLKSREYQHNYLLRTGKKKELYDYCRREKITELELIPIHNFKTKVEAKRFEMYLILYYRFIIDNGLEVPLWASVDLMQTIPSIRDM